MSMTPTSRDRGEAGPFERARGLFKSAFGVGPTRAASAPGRVNLIGEHTDYNDGLVLPMALEQRTAVVLGAAEDGLWRFVSEQEPARAESMTASEMMDPARRGWTAYVRGVVAGFAASGHGAAPMRVAVASDVPLGGGLSSSAALEVAAATALEGALGVGLGAWEKVLLCQRAEHAFAGTPCGIMDQASAVLARAGHALLLDCRSRETTAVPLGGGATAVLVMNSMVRHDLAGGEYARRKADCEAAVGALRGAGFGAVRALRDATPAMLGRLPPGSRLFRRARHVVSEIARTRAAAAALAEGDAAALGTLMDASHASLRDDYEVSCPELDVLVEAVRGRPGVHGARMTGGGFGGCVVALVDTRHAGAAGATAARLYAARTGLTPEWFITRGGRGAHAEGGAG
jgi:galactokinase